MPAGLSLPAGISTLTTRPTSNTNLEPGQITKAGPVRQALQMWSKLLCLKMQEVPVPQHLITFCYIDIIDENARSGW
jgi:hypothetical protein